LKNDAEQAEELLPYFDWSLVEECSVYDWCGLLQPFIQAGKPVFQVEYTETYDSPDKFCSQTRQSRYSGLLKNIDLDAWVEYCP
jgi:endo-alpha-1,4-polygalactosaminidase (GH114 family)